MCNVFEYSCDVHAVCFFQCVLGQATLDCTFSMDIPTSKVSLLARQQTRTTAQFLDGRLLAVFGDVVSGWFKEEDAFARAAMARTQANTTFHHVAIQVVNRFLEQAGSPFPEEQFASSIKAHCAGLRSNTTIFDISVCLHAILVAFLVSIVKYCCRFFLAK